MAMLLQSLLGVCGIASLVCFVLVVIQMFQRGATGVAVASLLLFLCGIGSLIAFIYGWIKSSEWGIQRIMYAWTAAIVASIVLYIAVLALVGPTMEPGPFN